MQVTVWDTSAPQFALNEGQTAVAALKQLGYRATLRILPDSTYFTYTNDIRNHAQIVDEGWSVDYPTANDFFAKLKCSGFIPDNGPGTIDNSFFCNPAIDKQINRAASLQTTDPAAAIRQWTRLDRELTNLAIWLPTVTANETDLISPRVGNYQYNPLWGALVDQLWVR